MEFLDRPYTAGDYPIVREWWFAHNAKFLDPEGLPQTGVIVSFKKNGDWVPCCVSWIFFTSNAKISKIEYTTVHPHVPMKVKREAVDRAISYLTRLSESVGITQISTLCDRSGLIKAYKRAGFKEVKTHMLLAKGSTDA